MQVKLSIGGIGFFICYQEELEIRGLLKQYAAETREDIRIDIVKRKELTIPDLPYTGENLFCRYYGGDHRLQVEVKGAKGIPGAAIICENHMHNIRYELNLNLQTEFCTLNSIVSFLPMKHILHYFNAFLFHASRIAVDGKAILFTGPSGVGKTTQSVLWENYESARHLCNDRTIIRLEKEQWNTYGYFEDGSEPIADTQCLPLAAIVILRQDVRNEVYRENGKKAFMSLIEQIFLERWDYGMVDHIMELVSTLLQDIPIFYLSCVPDKTAVECLKEKLKSEGVIN